MKHNHDPREFCILSKEFLDDGKGNVAGIKTVKVEWTKDATGRWKMDEVPNSEKVSGVLPFFIGHSNFSFPNPFIA